MSFLLKTTLLTLFLISFVGTTAFSQTANFSGRVTDQTTGQAIPNVAVVAEGNLTGTRVAISDAVGNYTLEMGANTNLKIRAYRTNFVFNPIFVGFVSVGGSITGPHTLDFTGTALPFPILIFAQAPVLLTEDSSLQALAVDSQFHLREPFQLINSNYPGNDKRTRISLLLVDLELFQGETLSIITAQATDESMIAFDLLVEDLRKVPGVPWLSQLTIRLPDLVTLPNDLAVTVTARGKTSNAVNFRIR